MKMKKQIIVLLLLAVTTIGYSQDYPLELEGGLQLPNATEETNPLRLPVMDNNGFVNFWVNPSNYLTSADLPSPINYGFNHQIPYMNSNSFVYGGLEFVDNTLAVKGDGNGIYNPKIRLWSDLGSVDLITYSVTGNNVQEFQQASGVIALTSDIHVNNDNSSTNEIQTLSKTGADITLSNGGGTVIDVNTQLTEPEVDAYVANNGYITGVNWNEIGGNQSDVSLVDFDNDLNVSAFPNDAGYITGVNWNEIGGNQSDIVLGDFDNDLNVSAFPNDAGYITNADGGDADFLDGYDSSELSKKVFSTFSSGNSHINKWTKIARVTISSQYHMYNAVLQINNHSTQNTTINEELEIRIHQQSSFGTNPIINLTNYKKTNKNSYIELAYKIVQNTPTTIVELYLKPKVSYCSSIGQLIMERKTNTVDVEYFSYQSFYSSIQGLINFDSVEIFTNANDISTTTFTHDTTNIASSNLSYTITNNRLIIKGSFTVNGTTDGYKRIANLPPIVRPDINRYAVFYASTSGALSRLTINANGNILGYVKNNNTYYIDSEITLNLTQI